MLLITFEKSDYMLSPKAYLDTSTAQLSACLLSSITTLNKSDNVRLLSGILDAIYAKQLILQHITFITSDFAEIPIMLKTRFNKRLKGVWHQIFCGDRMISFLFGYTCLQNLK